MSPRPSKPTTAEKQKKRRRAQVKTGMDKFWYFAVVVIALVFVLYTNAVNFDESEGKLLMQIVPIIASVFGFSAYRDTMAQKKQLEDEEDVEDEQEADDETPDGANET